MATAVVCIDIETGYGTTALAGPILDFFEKSKSDYLVTVVHDTGKEGRPGIYSKRKHPDLFSYPTESSSILIRNLPQELRTKSSHLIIKRGSSAFSETNSLNTFDQLNIDTAFFTGAFAGVCVPSSAFDFIHERPTSNAILVPNLIYSIKNGKLVLLSNDKEVLEDTIADLPRAQFKETKELIQKRTIKLPEHPLVASNREAQTLSIGSTS